MNKNSDLNKNSNPLEKKPPQPIRKATCPCPKCGSHETSVKIPFSTVPIVAMNVDKNIIKF